MVVVHATNGHIIGPIYMTRKSDMMIPILHSPVGFPEGRAGSLLTYFALAASVSPRFRQWAFARSYNVQCESAWGLTSCQPLFCLLEIRDLFSLLDCDCVNSGSEVINAPFRWRLIDWKLPACPGDFITRSLRLSAFSILFNAELLSAWCWLELATCEDCDLDWVKRFKAFRCLEFCGWSDLLEYSNNRSCLSSLGSLGNRLLPLPLWVCNNSTPLACARVAKQANAWFHMPTNYNLCEKPSCLKIQIDLIHSCFIELQQSDRLACPVCKKQSKRYCLISTVNTKHRPCITEGPTEMYCVVLQLQHLVKVLDLWPPIVRSTRSWLTCEVGKGLQACYSGEKSLFTAAVLCWEMWRCTRLR